MSAELDTLRDRLADLQTTAEGIVTKADTEKRDLSEQESKDVDEANGEFDRLEGEIERRERVDKQKVRLAQPQERQTVPSQPTLGPVADVIEDRTDEPSGFGGRRTVPAQPRSPHEGRWGWRSMGEFSIAVRNGCAKGAILDKRLEQRAPTTFGSEGVGSDGGFAVPPDFREAITSQITGEDSLLGRTDQFVSSGNSITVPVDSDAPWSSSGIQAYWEGENDQLTQSKPLIEQQTIRLNKLAVLVPVTDELLEDAPAMDAYLRRKVPEKMDFKLNLAIVQGNGVGMPLGILNSPAAVAVAAVGSQDADTVVGSNIIAMWSRMYAPSRATSVWLINQDIEPQLLTLMHQGKDDTGTADAGWGAILYLPANGLSGAPFSTLMGRPIIPTQACETLGDKGDIIFADLKQYMTALKTGGVRAETSIHLWFDYDTTAFRFILRIAGQPWWGSAVSPRDGSNTLSPFVTLAAR